MQLFVFDEEIDLDGIVEEVGRDWRAVFAELARELDLAFIILGGNGEPIHTEFRLRLNGEDVDLEALAVEVGRDWRPMIAKLAPLLVAALPGSWWPCFDPADIDAIFSGVGLMASAGQDTFGALAAQTKG
jgi:hypothetical protein